MLEIILYIMIANIAMLLLNICYIKSYTNKLLFLNALNSIIILVIILLAIIKNSDFYIDVALIYASFGFTINLAIKLTKYK
jgi:multisubunit Na+/H+ antiporter MnhF subunit